MKFSATPQCFLSIACISNLLCGCASRTEPAVTKPLPESTPSPATIESDSRRKELPEAVFTINGKAMRGWQITDFGGNGGVTVKDGVIKIDMGAELTGIHWTNESVLPKMNYEIELDAMKVDGGDFFCGLTVPVSNSFCTLIVGGWGGGIVGISSINGADASENDSTRSLYFPRDRWYHIRLQVRADKIAAWIDGDKVFDVELEGRKISMRGGEIESSIPLGVATYQTTALVRNIRLKTL